ncbi:MAG: UDP-N-acetylglucosamine diphosphorylase [Opitutaceae bacterium]
MHRALHFGGQICQPAEGVNSPTRAGPRIAIAFGGSVITHERSHLALLHRMKASDFFVLPISLSLFAHHFRPDVPPWEWLKQIGAALAQLTDPPSRPECLPGVHFEGKVWIHPTVKLPPCATLIGPVWIGANTEIRPGTYIRGNVIAGENCVLGNACEFKNCLLMDGVMAPHFNYVGDSILGNDAHFGAGVICSNLRFDQQPIVVRTADTTIETGLRKFGAIVGDNAEIGCNAVLNPGTLLGPRALVSPAIAVSGHVPAATIVHARVPTKLIPRRD